MNKLLLEKIRREEIRWLIMKSALDLSRPHGMYTEAIRGIVQAVYPDATHRDVRVEVDYLATRQLVDVEKDGMDRWFVNLTRAGIDVVEYTVPCEPGIARPTLTQDS